MTALRNALSIPVLLAGVAGTLLSSNGPASAACYQQQVVEAHLSCTGGQGSSADFATQCVQVPAGVYQVPVACPPPPPPVAPTPAPTPTPAPAPKSCTLNGITRQHGQSATFYFESSVPFILKCKGTTRTCNNGTFDGDTTYRQPSCVVETPKDCVSPWGSTVKHGTDIFAYPVPTLPYGYTCTPHKRSCWDGFLGGGGTHKTCVNQ